MALAEQPRNAVYPIAEMFTVSTSTTDAVDIWDIPSGTVITNVMVKVKTAGTGSGNLTIGDDDDADGYILAADATAAADTVYGDAPEERGAYTYSGVSYHSSKCKFYTSAGKELKLDCSNTLTTEATLEVFVFGFRFLES